MFDSSSAGTITATTGGCVITDTNGNTTPCTVGMTVHWGDTINTQSDGRITVTLYDQSVLAQGGSSTLAIEPHVAAVQQTRFQLWYGAVRAWVARITRSGGGFEYQTPCCGVGPQIGDLNPDGVPIDPSAPQSAEIDYPDDTSTTADGSTVSSITGDCYINPLLPPDDPNNWYVDVSEYGSSGNCVYSYSAVGSSCMDSGGDPGGCDFMCDMNP